MNRIVRQSIRGQYAAAKVAKEGASVSFPSQRRRICAPWPTFQVRGMARYEGKMPTLGPRDFVVLSPEVSGAGGMSVPAELGEIAAMSVQVGEHLAEDKIVAVIDTCKASVEARCRASGVVKEVLVSEGEEVWELQPLVVITCDEGIEGKILNW